MPFGQDNRTFSHLMSLCKQQLCHWDNTLIITDNPLINLAVYHRLTPFLGQSEQVTAVRRPQQVRGLQLVHHLMQLHDLFVAQDIAYLCIKGPALSQLLYHDPCLRVYSDLDIWVQKDQLSIAIDRLHTLGFSILGQGLHERLQNPKAKDIMLQHERSKLCIELHWALHNTPSPLIVDWGTAREHQQIVTIEGRDIPTLGNRHLLNYLCHHGQRHFWYRLQWLMDVAQLQLRHHGLKNSTSRFTNRLIRSLWEEPSPIDLWVTRPLRLVITEKLHNLPQGRRRWLLANHTIRCRF